MNSKSKSKPKESKKQSQRQRDTNEIDIKRRTLENNTHESIEDTKIRRISSWRRSRQKFFKNLIYNILTCGILHLISLFRPNLFIKLYCDPSPASECDYFLVENIYDKYTLCKIIVKKKKRNKSNMTEEEKENIENEGKKPELELTKNLTYSFVYKSTIYEYDEKKEEIIPVYMDLSKMTNKGILDFFLNGLSTRSQVNKFKERYGRNEYPFDIKLLFLFFLNNEVPSYAIVIFICIIQTAAFPDFTILIAKIGIVIGFIVIQLINIKITIINKYKKELTLDGNGTKIKVKRNYLIKDPDKFFIEIEPEELLPGDIIFLKENDFVPCDCIIMEGESIVSENNLTGKLDINKKTSLGDTSEFFNYRNCNVNILYHGMKIIKTFSKINDNYISALCINTGPNTFKANQYSNIFYFLERKKEYNYVYNLFGERKVIFYYIIISIFISLIYGAILTGILKEETNSETYNDLILETILGCFSECLMLPYFMSHSFMILLGIFRLQGNDILCFDKSRLINSGKINTIVFNKTGTLSKDELEISGFHIPNLNLQKGGNIVFHNYTASRSKEMNVHILNYYKEYLEIKENIKNAKNKNTAFFAFNKLNMKFDSHLTLFLECLLSCNNVEKFGIELFGSKIETTLFNDMKWDLKQYENANSNEKDKTKNFEKISVRNTRINNNSNYYLIQKKIYDIFPKNYYKLTESSKKSSNKSTKKNLLDINNINITSDKKQNQLLKSKSANSLEISQLISDIATSKTNSYKLRIYKKFIAHGSLSHSAIVYNFIKEELRFMTRGYPEDIICKCQKISVPDDFEEVVSFNRKNGLIVLVCATKLLDLEDYDDKEDLDFYMDELIFCGFITLKNKINDSVKYSIEQINELNCHTVISSADNEYNCLSTGFNSGIIENNNIFVFDKQEKYNKLFLKKIYSMKSIVKEDPNKKENKANDKVSKFSKISKNISFNKKNNEINSKKFKIKDLQDNGEINYKGPKLLRKKTLINLDEASKNEEASEIRKLNDISNLQISELNRANNNNLDFDPNKMESSKNLDNAILKNNKSNFQKNKTQTGEIINDNNFLFFQNISYYHGIFEDYEELRDGIYCISSAAFNFLYKNRTYKGIQYILEKLDKKSKIFFNMSALDKSRLIDYFRESADNVVCSIGECDSDLDAIISSNVGVSLKNPPNQNMILCHFYSSKKDIISLKKIITIGRLLYENSILLEIVSFSCAISINFFILGCIMRNISIKSLSFSKNQLRFLDLEFLILEMFSFAGEPREKDNIIKSKRLLNIYYVIQLSASLIFKLISIYLLEYLYKDDKELDSEERHHEYICSFFILTFKYY